MSRFAETFYLAMPVSVQQAVITAYGWWWYRRRFGAEFHRLVAEFKARECWRSEQFRRYQEEQLSNILSAASRSPYYRAVFDEVGVTTGVQSFEALKRLPLLTKETLRNRAKELLTENPAPRATVVFKSSGTTGTPTEIFYTPEFHSLELAVPEARNLGWAGVSYRDRRVMFGVRKVCSFDQEKPPFWRFSPAEDMAYASIYHLSARFLPSYLELLRSYRPDVIMGYPSALYTIARYAVENHDFPAPVKAVVTTSETVTDQARQAIEAAWGCRVYDRYGAVEGCLFASQCEYGRYHVSPEVGVIEILDSNLQPTLPGEMGEVICTGLQNALQPLIRYRIGDAARWAIEQDCVCGRAMPILERVEGRFEDICYTPDGRQMLRFDTVFKGVDNVRESQIVQEAVNLFTIFVVPAQEFSSRDVETIKKNMRLHVGRVNTQIKAVDVIPRTPSGKFKAVICNLSPKEKAHIASIKAA